MPIHAEPMKLQFFLLCPLFFFATLLGCKATSSRAGSQSDFSLELASPTISVVPGGATQTLVVAISPANSFQGSVAVSVGSLPTGLQHYQRPSLLLPAR
jgi:ABC-type uncharacterized transport system auxiliary subunit